MLRWPSGRVFASVANVRYGKDFNSVYIKTKLAIGLDILPTWRLTLMYLA